MQNVKDQKKLEKHFPFLKSVCDVIFLIEQIDQLDDVDYESMYKKLSQKHKEVIEKELKYNPKLIVWMNNLTEQQIEIMSYFSDKKIDYNMIEIVDALKTFDMTKMPFFKMLIDTLTSFKVEPFSKIITLNLPYLLSLNVEDWGKISAKLMDKPRESTLSNLLEGPDLRILYD